eukprot:2423886-Pyramimonas_sp.AAC.1
MLWCAVLCCRVRQKGLVHFGVDCRSYAWISRWQSGRSSHDPVVNESYHLVSVGNIMALFVSWMCTHLNLS